MIVCAFFKYFSLKFFESGYLIYFHTPKFDLVNNIYLEGTMSSNFQLGPGFCFMSKNGKHFTIF